MNAKSIEFFDDNEYDILLSCNIELLLCFSNSIIHSFIYKFDKKFLYREYCPDENVTRDILFCNFDDAKKFSKHRQENLHKDQLIKELKFNRYILGFCEEEGVSWYSKILVRPLFDQN